MKGKFKTAIFSRLHNIVLAKINDNDKSTTAKHLISLGGF